MKKIYLALPFSGIEELSFKVANEVASILIGQNYYVFSPVSHSYPIWTTGMVPHTYEVWLGQDKIFMDWCDEVFCIVIEGVEGVDGRKLIEASRGVQTEFKWANEQNKPIQYIYYNPNTKDLTYAETN